MEFVCVRYPRLRRVLVDGEDFSPTNKTFRVERGTHVFAVDEPADPPEIEVFIELTSQQSPRELSFAPAAVAAMAPVARRATKRTKRAPKTAKKRKTAKKARSARPATRKTRKVRHK